jgi:hypothetical protein
MANQATIVVVLYDWHEGHNITRSIGGLENHNGLGDNI